MEALVDLVAGRKHGRTVFLDEPNRGAGCIRRCATELRDLCSADRHQRFFETSWFGAHLLDSLDILSYNAT